MALCSDLGSREYSEVPSSFTHAYKQEDEQQKRLIQKIIIFVCSFQWAFPSRFHQCCAFAVSVGGVGSFVCCATVDVNPYFS